MSNLVVPKFLKPFLDKQTDETRQGSIHCPYCSGWHSNDAELDACARRHSRIGSTYQCPRCKRYHLTLNEASHCCEEEKRFEQRYDQSTYQGYTESESGGDSFFDSIFGSSRTSQPESTNSGGGFIDSYLGAGGSKSEPKKGGGFWPWD